MMKKVLNLSAIAALTLSLNGCFLDEATSVATGACVYEYNSGYYTSVTIINDYPIDTCNSIGYLGYDTYSSNKSCSDFYADYCYEYDFDYYGGF